MQGSFTSTAFRVRDEQAFATDPAVLAMEKHMDLYAGKRDGATLHCVASKGTQPKTNHEDFAPAIRPAGVAGALLCGPVAGGCGRDVRESLS